MASGRRPADHDPSSMTDLEWTNLLSEIDTNTALVRESQMQRLKRKFLAEPFIPIGSAATVCCLAYGLKSMASGNVQHSQYAMRGRVLAQGATIVVVAFGMYFGVSSTQKYVETTNKPS